MAEKIKESLDKTHLGMTTMIIRNQAGPNSKLSGTSKRTQKSWQELEV